MNDRRRFLGLALVLLIATAIVGFGVSGTPPEQLDQSEFYAAVDAGQIEEVDMAADGIGYQINGKFRSDGTAEDDAAARSFTAYVLEDENLAGSLRAKGVQVTGRKSQRGSLLSMLAVWIPLLLVLGIFVFFMRSMQKGGGQTMNMMKSKAKLSATGNKTTFKDVAGVEEAKQELQEIIEFLKNPKKFQKLGGKIPKGVLLVGPTGTGKTLLARAVAGEAEVPFFSVSGSDFVEMFVGIGATRVRELFERGQKNAPCIIFIDEIDSVGRHRGAGVGGGHDEREQTLNQLLVQMDGFDSHEGVIVLAATNRPDVLDPALMRPGRFDRQVIVDRPDVRGREEILKIHARKITLEPGVDMKVVARGTPGFSGADLANLANEAALIGALKNHTAVTQDDLDAARDKVLMGAARQSLIVSDVEKRAAAYHEAGHALVAHMLPGADPIHKVTIIPRGRGLGKTQQLPTDDRLTESKRSLMNVICVLLGGRLAEELQLGRQSTSAGEDFQKTSQLARRMVSEWGMSKKLGPLNYGKGGQQVFLGREMAKHRDHSEEITEEIDAEARKIVMTCYDKVRDILEKNAAALVRIAEALLEREVLDAEQIADLVNDESEPALPPGDLRPQET